MSSIRIARAAAVVLVATFVVASCSTDPNVAKVRYLQSGNKYFDKGKFKEARIMYLRAKSKDQRYGEAYYHLGLTDLKLGSVVEAVNSFRRAIELIPADGPNGADHWDSIVRLADLYLQVTRDKPILDEVQTYAERLLKRDPNSFDGHRISADLAFARAGELYKVAQRDEGAKLLDLAIVEYRKADAVKPGQVGVAMQLARVLSARGDYAGAEDLYKRVMAKDKTYQPAYAELYKLYFFQQKMAEGEQTLKLAFQNNPKVYAYLTMLAMHYSVQKRRDDMLAVLQQIKSHAKDFDQAYIVVGDFYLRLGDGESAIREYREGMAKNASKKSTYQKKIIEVLMRQGKRNEAAELTAQILKDDPNDADARGLSATFLLDKGDINRALAELQAVVTRAPDNAVARYNLGRAHAARLEWELARQQFQKAIELRPDYVLARLALAQLQVTRGEFDAALKTSEQILAIDRGNVNARLIESAALMGQRKFGESRQLLEAMLKAAPNSPDVLFQMGVVNLAENRYKDAEDAFRRAYELNPANSRGLMGIVETDMAQNRPEAAITLLQAEAAKYPNRMDFHLAIGNTAVRAGKYDLAIGEFQKVLDSLDKGSRSRGDLYLRIGETYRRKGDLGNSILNLQKARETLPENVVVLSTLALVLDSAGRRSEARQVYEATIKIDGNNGVALNNLAFLLAENGGDLDQALSMATKAKQLLPNLNEVSDTLGWIYLKKNLSDKAVDMFSDLVVKAPQQATFHYHLGMALSQKGDKTRALKELQEALKNNPSKEDREKIQALIQRLS
jgi:tetratricopeptide (TPR) repeat protein